MKTLPSFFFCLSLFTTASLFAQTKTETLAVSGECGTCKKKIETAAKSAGASYAVWNKDNKILTVKYKGTSTTTARIEKAVAAAGYDTPDVKASDKAYDKLDDCCKYDRATSAKASCCNDAKCTETSCFKDGKCTTDSACCKEAGCDQKACCKKS